MPKSRLSLRLNIRSFPNIFNTEYFAASARTRCENIFGVKY